MYMRYGYMPSVNENLLCELDFAKENFDFVEITYVPGAGCARIGRRALEEALSGFPAKGHINWSCDFSTVSDAQILKAKDQLCFFHDAGISEVTLHPSPNRELHASAIIQNNISSFARLYGFCKGKGMSLHLENTVAFPFNKPPALNSILHAFPKMKFTLDVGHTLASYSENYLPLLHQISRPPSHIHLHDAALYNDHIPFESKEKMLHVMSNVKKFNKNATVTLEIFYKFENGKRTPLTFSERKPIMLSHLRALRRKL